MPVRLCRPPRHTTCRIRVRTHPHQQSPPTTRARREQRQRKPTTRPARQCEANPCRDVQPHDCPSAGAPKLTRILDFAPVRCGQRTYAIDDCTDRWLGPAGRPSPSQHASRGIAPRHWHRSERRGKHNPVIGLCIGRKDGQGGVQSPIARGRQRLLIALVTDPDSSHIETFSNWYSGGNKPGGWDIIKVRLGFSVTPWILCCLSPPHDGVKPLGPHPLQLAATPIDRLRLARKRPPPKLPPAG